MTKVLDSSALLRMTKYWILRFAQNDKDFGFFALLRMTKVLDSSLCSE
ncbi:MAG: hypothetical protein IPL53_19760 [Ignavibacteria bacterium]|nr:hypothetical protein [Ignavibacteria bacterium]